MEKEQKTIAMVILGIVAVIAVVGLVLMFVRGQNATGKGVYGGAIKQVDFPYWAQRGTPRNMPDGQVPGALWPEQAGKDLTTNWNYYGNPKRNPKGNVPSVLSKCGNGGFLVSYNNGEYYNARGYRVIDTGESKAGLCVYPNQPMVGGTI